MLKDGIRFPLSIQLTFHQNFRGVAIGDGLSWIHDGNHADLDAQNHYSGVHDARDGSYYDGVRHVPRYDGKIALSMKDAENCDSDWRKRF